MSKDQTLGEAWLVRAVQGNCKAPTFKPIATFRAGPVKDHIDWHLALRVQGKCHMLVIRGDADFLVIARVEVGKNERDSSDCLESGRRF